MTSVGVGIPVWNGAAYLADAVESLLAQTTRPDHILIADNGSTDDSVAIAEGIAAAEPTISVLRRDENVGAAGNYNDLVDRVETDLFAWLPHDDRWSPDLLESLVHAHADPGVAISYGRRRSIGPDGAALAETPGDIIWSDSHDPIERLRELFEDPHHSHLHDCSAVLGLARRDVLRTTARVQPFGNSDKVLLVELALHGRLVPVDAIFERRVHEMSSVKANPDDTSRRRWFDPNATGPDLPQFRLWRGYREGIDRAPLSPAQRRAARRLVRSWALEGRRPRMLAGEARQQLAWTVTGPISRRSSTRS